MLSKTHSSAFFPFFFLFSTLSPVIFLSLANKFAGLPVHYTGASPSLLPGVVVLYQTGDQLIRQLRNSKHFLNISAMWRILITWQIITYRLGYTLTAQISCLLLV